MKGAKFPLEILKTTTKGTVMKFGKILPGVCDSQVYWRCETIDPEATVMEFFAFWKEVFLGRYRYDLTHVDSDGLVSGHLIQVIESKV